MPPRGYRDTYKKLVRELLPPEHLARQKAAFRREPDLSHLIKIARLQDRHGMSAHDAAGKIADEIGGVARVRHANQKRLYRKFQIAPALYRRLALAADDDPANAADREICEELGLPWRPRK
jgi:hypothetical protein